MIPPLSHIIVSVNLDQKQKAVIGDNLLLTGKEYNDNFRERNPVVAFVEYGIGKPTTSEIPTGAYIVCNYSHFDLESPLYLYDNLYSIPVNEEIYATINDDGSLNPVMGNLLVERITKESTIEIPEELKKPYLDRGILLTETKDIKKGSFILWLKMADYQICYTWKGKELSALKIHQSEITGYFKS